MADTKDLTITQGKTFSLVIRWGTEPVIRKPITAISLDTGAPRLSVTAHGIPNGWEAYVTRAKGMPQINAENNPPRKTDFRPVTVIDAGVVEFNTVDPVDASGKEWPAYTSGGFLCWNTPVDLTGYTARMKIKDKIGGAVLASTEVGDFPLNVLTITVSAAGSAITLEIAATATDDFAWKTGVYDIEMVSPTGKVDAILTGKVTVSKEVTT